ncbi:MAG: bifunctional nuclease family protein [Bacteroidetes bacterium]|nr:bifunctional nuclease family protein [Bacteroidota bacterium]HNR20221.1 bifunctional nuclease family protein [Bacteroidia bacterium]HNU34250.1 bifunctional nuclease family protein [Bacteroidia bacterium]
MKKIRLEIAGLSFSQTQSGAYALVLGEQGGNRRLPIIIGGFEAQAIAVELESMTPTRPLTHDLFKNFALAFKIHVDEVIVYNLKEGIFYSKLICNNGDSVIEIDARTSDAIAMAVRFNCPIYTYEFILSQAGVVMDDETANEETPAPATQPKSEKKVPVEKKKSTPASSSNNDFSSLTTEELKEELMRAIDEEAYEKAGKIRDELSRRKAG